MNPGGRFVVVGGPDGVGKTSLARALVAAWPGEARYFHFRPPTRGQMRTVVPRPGRFVAAKEETKGSPIGGWARLGFNFARFWVGYLRVIRPAVARGALVVGDRWAYGYLVQPQPLKYFGPRWLAKLAVALLPRPDLVVVLTAPPAVVASRKAELTEDQIQAEAVRWAQIPHRNVVTLDALEPPEALARQVLDSL